MHHPVIAVTGINAVDNPGPGIGVARCLRAVPGLEPRILGLAYDAMEPGVFLDWVVDRSFLLPYPSGDPESFIARLVAIRERHGLDIVIPNLDAELPVFIRYADELRRAGIATLLPSAEQFRLRGKDRLPDLAARTGMEVPPTFVVGSATEACAALARIGGAGWVKGCFYEAHRVATEAQAAEAFHHLAADWGLPVLVQGSIEGEHLNVVGLGDGTGGHCGLVGIRKVWTTKQGKMWTGVTVRHEAMLDAARRFVRSTCWRGPFELECIVSGDRIFLIEINPRFPAWTYLSAGVGVNLPERLVQLLLGREPDREDAYEPGRLFVRYSFELVGSMETVRDLITTGEHA